jgi:LysM repeat protein
MNRFVLWASVALFAFASVSCTREKPSSPSDLPPNIALAPTPTSIPLIDLTTPVAEPSPTPTLADVPTLVVPFSPSTPILTTSSPAARPATYTVQVGDWLSKISRQFGVTNQALLDANPNLNLSVLIPGQVLNIPGGVGGGSQSTPTKTTQAPNPTSTPVPSTPRTGKTTYTVQFGDWLSKIARQFGVTNQAILAANPDLNPNLLVPGQVITIPVAGAPAPTSTPGSNLNATPVPTSNTTRTPTSTPRPTSTTGPVSFSGSGPFGYGVQLNWTNVNNSDEMNWVTGMGFGWAKVQVRWCDFEGSPGNINYGMMDQLIGAAGAKGVRVMFSVVCAPSWSRADGGAGGSGPPDDMQKAADFMATLAGKYCGGPLGAIEVWNEHNLQTEWHGKPISAVSYLDMLKRSYSAIKARCPRSQSSRRDLTGVTNNVAIDDVAFLQQMYSNGLKNYSDAIGAHPSGFCNSPDASEGSSNPCGGGWNNHRSFFFKRTLESYRSIMVQNGDAAKRIWPTEFGWGVDANPKPGYEYERSLSDDLQAQWLTKAFQAMRGYGYIGVAFVWNLDFTDMGNETGAFHILNRAAYSSLASMAK